MELLPNDSATFISWVVARLMVICGSTASGSVINIFHSNTISLSIVVTTFHTPRGSSLIRWYWHSDAARCPAHYHLWRFRGAPGKQPAMRFPHNRGRIVTVTSQLEQYTFWGRLDLKGSLSGIGFLQIGQGHSGAFWDSFPIDWLYHVLNRKGPAIVKVESSKLIT